MGTLLKVDGEDMGGDAPRADDRDDMMDKYDGDDLWRMGTGTVRDGWGHGRHDRWG